MDHRRTYNALTEIPESLTVGELNQAVRDLRELLHEQTLKAQGTQNTVNGLITPKVIEAVRKTNRRFKVRSARR